MEYTKPALSYTQQLDLLISRGLQVSDRNKALLILSQISYYRLSAYCIPFHIEKDKFHGTAKLEDVYRLYCFDKELRFLVLSFLEPIEVAFRTALTYHLSHKYGPFSYAERAIFSPRFEHAEWLKSVNEEISRSREVFIEHYRTKYNKMTSLPLWMATEIFSFGALSKMFRGLKDEDKSLICSKIEIPHEVVSSWLHTFTYIRNVCAHHSRLWNKILAIEPKIPRKLPEWEFLRVPNGNKKIFSAFTILHYLNSKLDLSNGVKPALIKLFDTFPEVDIARMGFQDGWYKEKFWV